jgi:hypothetical protein
MKEFEEMWPGFGPEVFMKARLKAQKMGLMNGDGAISGGDVRSNAGNDVRKRNRFGRYVKMDAAGGKDSEDNDDDNDNEDDDDQRNQQGLSDSEALQIRTRSTSKCIYTKINKLMAFCRLCNKKSRLVGATLRDLQRNAETHLNEHHNNGSQHYKYYGHNNEPQKRSLKPKFGPKTFIPRAVEQESGHWACACLFCMEIHRCEKLVKLRRFVFMHYTARNHLGSTQLVKDEVSFILPKTSKSKGYSAHGGKGGVGIAGRNVKGVRTSDAMHESYGDDEVKETDDFEGEAECFVSDDFEDCEDIDEDIDDEAGDDPDVNAGPPGKKLRALPKPIQPSFMETGDDSDCDYREY